MEAEAAAEDRKLEFSRPAVVLVCGSLVYYHCAYRESSLLSLIADVLIVLLCSLAILGMLFRQMNISYALAYLPLFASIFASFIEQKLRIRIAFIDFRKRSVSLFTIPNLIDPCILHYF
ncbi:hypothetical protein HPP92_023858 [Vanilla planifolia]|uniref:Reticulon-like protein n=1 Tax=Vanilla planifolia TaxID=51239 RepID=A0A835PIM7_VANPL|nr:hypothetical protein HPP92_023858 [Vanilla planifolia]